jgi:hypothetical protein
MEKKEGKLAISKAKFQDTKYSTIAGLTSVLHRIFPAKL